ncbi:MAG: DUF2769 domain-containing protein [Deltaproteobacteria bacterium HGW-Deltaproteobacteria-1]|jgi:hypothetical protein|nr:MAG: DUF2769 domain-containing protein [Deltaproteobacteria bacterium HGW-Deltaproteobacteria-1]
MNETVGTKIPFNSTNVGKCMCPKCPVQAKSQCVSGKLTSIKDALAKTSLIREDIPGVYCSTGTATCKDLDPKQSCICGGCAIFSQFNLAAGLPAGYFCRDGFAK